MTSSAGIIDNGPREVLKYVKEDKVDATLSMVKTTFLENINQTAIYYIANREKKIEGMYTYLLNL